MGAFFERDVAELEEALRARGFSAPCVRPQNVHVTLHFFGDLAPPSLEAASLAASRAASRHAALQIGLSGLGAFPALRSARVLWVGLSGQVDELVRLQSDLAFELAHEGFHIEKRVFQAHATIARFRRPPQAAEIRAMESMGRFRSAGTAVLRQILLYESRLGPQGPAYTPLASFSLASV